MSLATSKMPTIAQIFNACGISSVVMGLKPNLNNILDDFLRKLEKKVTKTLKISKEQYDFEERVQYAVTWLLLHIVFDRIDLLDKIVTESGFSYFNVGDVKAILISKFDEMLVYQKTKGYNRITKDIEKLLSSGIITRAFLEAYLDEQKNDIELKFIALMFGLIYTPIQEEMGGNPVGSISHLDPRLPEQYKIKVDTLALHITNGAVLANYEYHWLALREIGKRIGEFEVLEKDARRINEIATTPHYFLFNNPLSGSILKVITLEMIEKYTFYCFETHLSIQEKLLKVLKSDLKL